MCQPVDPTKLARSQPAGPKLCYQSLDLLAASSPLGGLLHDFACAARFSSDHRKIGQVMIADALAIVIDVAVLVKRELHAKTKNVDQKTPA
jgi:hypothetical protein